MAAINGNNAFQIRQFFGNDAGNFVKLFCHEQNFGFGV